LTVILGGHLVRDWMARRDRALQRAVRDEELATTNLWYARVCKSAARNAPHSQLGPEVPRTERSGRRVTIWRHVRRSKQAAPNETGEPIAVVRNGFGSCTLAVGSKRRSVDSRGWDLGSSDAEPQGHARRRNSAGGAERKRATTTESCGGSRSFDIASPFLHEFKSEGDRWHYHHPEPGYYLDERNRRDPSDSRCDNVVHDSRTGRYRDLGLRGLQDSEPGTERDRPDLRRLRVDSRSTALVELDS
jgi:hypothetical protein